MSHHSSAFLVGLLLLLGTPAHAADFHVIVSPDIKASSISIEDLKGVFLGTKSALSDGSRVEPVLVKEGSAHEAFLDALGKTDVALQTYYRSLVFTGKGSMPRSFASDAEAVAYVAKHKGVIAYVSPAAATSGVRVLDVK